MRLITDWLDGSRNFTVGRAIYRVLGKDVRLKRLFEQGQTSFSANALVAAISSIENMPVTAEATEDIVFVEMPAEDDNVLRGITTSWKEKYMRMNLLRHKLDEYGTDNSPEAVAACEPLCKEILQLEKEIVGLWKQRDHYQQHGTLPDVKTKKKELPAEPAKAAKAIENIKKNIRRNKLHMQKNPGKPAYAQMHKDYIQQYRELTGEDYKERIK